MLCNNQEKLLNEAQFTLSINIKFYGLFVRDASEIIINFLLLIYMAGV